MKPESLSRVDELRPEYRLADLKEGVRGKYLDSYRASTHFMFVFPPLEEGEDGQNGGNGHLGTESLFSANATTTDQATVSQEAINETLRLLLTDLQTDGQGN